MTRSFLALRLLVLVCLVVTLGTGCGGSSSVAIAPVRGKVTVGGEPLTGGQVSYIPVSADPNAKGFSAGAIGAGGEYTIYTAGKAGAPLGQYKVTVTPPMVPSADGKPLTTPYHKKYSDAKQTPLTIEVVSTAAPGAYDLKLSK